MFRTLVASGGVKRTLPPLVHVIYPTRWPGVAPIVTVAYVDEFMATMHQYYITLKAATAINNSSGLTLQRNLSCIGVHKVEGNAIPSDQPTASSAL
jgi:hypothetical protein